MSADLDADAVANLTKSLNTIGQIYPTLYDTDGEILSGKHRQAAGGDKSDTVNTELIAQHYQIPRAVAKVLVKLHANVQRQVRREESRALLLQMAEAFAASGTPNEEIAQTVTRWAPFGQSYILELLPAKYKQPAKVSAGQAKSAPPAEQVAPPTVVNSNLKEPKSYPSPRASDFRRRTDTPAEMRILEELTKRRHVFLSQVPFPRDGVNAEGKPLVYVADIVVNQQVIVEIDGAGHDFQGDPERDAFFEKLGYAIHHIPNDHALQRPVFAVDELEHILARASKNGLAPADMKQQILTRISEQIHLGLLRHDFTPTAFWASLLPIDAAALKST